MVWLLLRIAFVAPNPTEFQLLAFRVFLALGAAGVGALPPGFMEVEHKGLLRAGGATAFFALVYLVNPASLVAKPDAPQPEATEPTVDRP